MRLSGEESKAHRREYQRQFAANYRKTHPPKDRSEYLRVYGQKRHARYAPRRAELDAARYERDRDKNLAHSKEYHQTKKEEIAARKAAWRSENIEERHRKEEAYRKSPAGRAANKNSAHRRRAQKFACEHPATPAEILDLETRVTACHYCGSTDRLTLDHFYPLAKGGSHAIWNLVRCCKSCNSRKSALLPSTWAKRSGFVFAWPLVPQDK